MSSLTLIAANSSSRRPPKESRFQNPKRFSLTTRFRKEKVRVIRQQLTEDLYDLDEHLDAAVDNLFAVLAGPKMV